MSYDLQKADIWKRASAFLLDLILSVIAMAGFIWLMTFIMGTNGHFDAYSSRMDHYSAEYGVELDKLDADAYGKLSEEDRARVDTAWAEFAKDEEANYAYNMMIQTMILSISVGILLAFLLLEFAVPMFLKNGQTIGKKVFGLGVMRIDGVKISGQILFIRSILGKYTVETMIPLMMFVWMMIGQSGPMAIVIILLVLISNIAMMIATRTNSCIHDMLAQTVTVDMASQMIFDSPEALLEYKQKLHAEAVERTDY